MLVSKVHELYPERLKSTTNKATTNVIKARYPLNGASITHMHAWAESADTRNPCHMLQPPAHINEQIVSTKPKLSQAAHASVTQAQLNVRL